jgi:hypothetical protein
MTPASSLGRLARRAPWSPTALALVSALALAAGLLVSAGPAAAAPGPDLPPAGPLTPAEHAAGDPDLGPNVYVFDPSMPVSRIQATVDAVAAQQVSNQFGTERYALLFKPGTYGSAAEPLNFQVGYYTEVAGLGRDPGDVLINGSVDVYNQNGIALNNFWRSLSNLTIDVTTPNAGCYTGEFWAVSQAAPMRRVHVNGQTTLMDYCTGPSYASGGFIADSQFSGTVINGSQQQWYTRSSDIGTWTNGVWNQVFSGDVGAPAECFPAAASCGGPYTTLATTPLTRERPYLYVDDAGRWRVFVPAAQHAARGTTWSGSSTAGRSVPLSDFYVASPADKVSTINSRLARGDGLLLTPGVYDVDRTIDVKRPDTVVLGLGLPTLTAQGGVVALATADVPGIDLAGLSVDAGPQTSPVLMRIGTPHGKKGSAADPTALQDVFFRIGGPHEGRATTTLVVDADHVLLDDIWAWRADHGAGVGWTRNTADTGLVVNGDDVQATGLFVEHYQKHEVVWNGERGSVVFFQNEMPYDVPSQDAWRSTPTTDGYAALKVAPGVTSFAGYGMGSYSFFNQGVDIFADHAFEVPTTPGVHLHDLLTIFLDASSGRGGIRHVVNDTGGSSTIANPDVPVTVVDYP